MFNKLIEQIEHLISVQQMFSSFSPHFFMYDLEDCQNGYIQYRLLDCKINYFVSEGQKFLRNKYCICEKF